MSCRGKLTIYRHFSLSLLLQLRPVRMSLNTPQKGANTRQLACSAACFFLTHSHVGHSQWQKNSELVRKEMKLAHTLVARAAEMPAPRVVYTDFEKLTVVELVEEKRAIIESKKTDAAID